MQKRVEPPRKRVETNGKRIEISYRNYDNYYIMLFVYGKVKQCSDLVKLQGILIFYSTTNNKL